MVLAVFDNIPPWVYTTLLAFIVGRTWASGRLGDTARRTRAAAHCFMLLFHTHEWGEWEKTRRHSWRHVEETVRYCKKCSETEYRLLDLFCPTYKRDGVYCFVCEPYAKAWERHVDKMSFDLYNKVDMEKETKKMGRPEKAARNRELFKKRQAGWSLGKLAEFYSIRKPTVAEIVKRMEGRQEKAQQR